MSFITKEVIHHILSSSNPPSCTFIVHDWDIKASISKPGAYFSSGVFRLTVNYDNDNNPSRKSFFLKIPQYSTMYEINLERGFYIKELLMYTKILPEMYKLNDEHFAAKYYFADVNHSLILADLSKLGFKTCDRADLLDFEHTLQALRVLAKFHASSVKLNQSFQVMDEIKNDTFHSAIKINDDIKLSILKGFQLFTENLHASIRRKYSKKLSQFRDNIVEEIVKSVTPSPCSFNVLNHGDYWINNIMFKHDKYGLVENTKMIDFQTTFWGNPAVDLIYLTMTSVKFEVFHKYCDILLESYLQVLNNTLSHLKCDTNYHMNDLQKDINDRYSIVLLVLSCQLPITLSDPDIPLDLKELCDQGDSNWNALREIFNQRRYQEMALKWFSFYADKGINEVYYLCKLIFFVFILK